MATATTIKFGDGLAVTDEGAGVIRVDSSGAQEADKNYVHTQGALAATWTVVHNLGKYGAVEVVDSGGSVIIPNVHYDSVNQVTLTFSAATSGKAYVN